MTKEFKEFPVCIYGEVEKHNEVLSKARCRIFYKYENRNGTYITDEFAEKLISSLPYVPVKGIYDTEDFTDHGEERNEGRIYGIVPENPNFAWEKHLDEDGVEREYACADVLIFTALYKEANEIVGKAQSMELYEPAIEYHFSIIKGQKYIVFDNGCFLGLQALGDQVEPCFEGASFYTLQKSIEDTIFKIKELSKGGQSEMPKINFKLSDSQKHDALWTLLNENYTEEGGWVVDYSICDIFDDYAMAYNYSEGIYERIYYVKNDDEDSITIAQKKKCYVIDVTEEEKSAVDTLRKLNGDTYELVNENLVNAEQNAIEIQNYGLKIEELNNTIATLNTEASEVNEKFDALNANYTAAQSTIDSLTTEVTDLRNYKYSIEMQQKEAVITEYAGKLSEEVLDTYREKLGEYTVLNLDKDLAYELKKTNPSVFSTQSAGFIPKDQSPQGIEAILSKYKK